MKSLNFIFNVTIGLRLWKEAFDALYLLNNRCCFLKPKDALPYHWDMRWRDRAEFDDIDLQRVTFSGEMRYWVKTELLEFSVAM